mgnify:CR=1 FL=1
MNGIANLMVKKGRLDMSGRNMKCGFASHLLRGVLLSWPIVVALMADAATVSITKLTAAQNETTLGVDISYDVSAVGLKTIPELRTEIMSSDGICLWSDIRKDVPAKTHVAVSWDAQVEWPGHLDEHVQVRVAARLEESKSSMVQIPGGSVKYWRKYDDVPLVGGKDWWYQIGNPPDDAENWEECVQRFEFWMDATEVTWDMWSAVTNWGIMNRGYEFTQEGMQPWVNPLQGNYPVENVDESTMMLWCNARSEMDGKAPLYYIGNEVYRNPISKYYYATVVLPEDMSKAGYRLPTDYEWEYAGRGGLVGMLFPWGDDYSTDKCNCPPFYMKDGMVHPIFQGRSSPAKYFAPNGYGLYDMAGNVAEFTHSAHSDGNGLTPHIGSGVDHYMGGSYVRMPTDGCFVGISNDSYVGAGTGFRSICLSDPPGTAGTQSIAYSDEFVIDTRVPEIVDWNLIGKDSDGKETEREEIFEGEQCKLGDPCLVAGWNMALRVTFKDGGYNQDRYPIRSVMLNGKGQGGPATKNIELKWAKIPDLIPDASGQLELPEKLPIGEGYHGKYVFTLEMEFGNLSNIEIEPKERTKKVFFEKKAKDNGKEPNWFVYWRTDGAVPGLSYEKCRYFKVAGADQINHINELTSVVNDENEAGNTWGKADPDTGWVTLYKDTCDAHYFKFKKSLKVSGFEFIYPWAYGIHTVANVMAHERKHAELGEEYNKELARIGLKKPLGKEDREKVRAELNTDYKEDWQITNVLKIYFKFYQRKHDTYIFYNDYLTDSQEEAINQKLGKDYGFSLDINDPDTFDLGKIKDKQYFKDGDNEFMALMAGYLANRDEGAAIEENDWAYPGHQSYLPKQLSNGITIERKPKSSTANNVGTLQSFANVAPLSIPEEEAASSTEESFVASNGVIMAVNGAAMARGEDDAVRYRLSFDVTGSMTMRFVGYLIDPTSNVVSCAGTTVDLSVNNNSCELAFPTNEIFASGLKGPYTLSGMVIYRVGDLDLVREGICREIETDWVTVARPQPKVAFATDTVSCSEGETLKLAISGGGGEKAASVKIYLSYQTAAGADLDFAKGTINGVVPKGGLKFPLTLNWEAGEAADRIVAIPVKADKAVEGDEQLTFQLASAQGQVLGTASVCAVTIKDKNTYAVLQDGAMNPGIKLSSKATKNSPAWQVGAGNAYDLNGLHGLCHAETPAMPMGSSSELAVGTFKKGKLRFHMRFTGPTDEKTPSTLSVYNGKNLVGTIGHGRIVRTGWALSVTNEWNAITLNANDKNNAVRFVFTQGSDPDVHVELSSLSYDDGNGATVCNIFAMASDSAGGCVTGSGPYVKGANVSIKAKANPGWVFRHWLAYGIEDRPIVWNDKAAVSWKATQDLTVEAVFEKLPYVRTLADPADGGKVTGSGYCAAGKKATLKATANKGYVFEGWYKVEDDPAGRMILPMATTPTLVLDRSAKPGKSNAQQTVVTTDADRDATYFAKFITVQEDLAAIALSVDGVALSATEAFATNLICGVAVNWPIVSSGLSETTVKVAGLPSGLKFAAKPVTSKVGTGKDAILVTNVPANTIYGAPTAASKTAKDRKTGAMTVTPNAIRVTVTTAGKSSQTYQINTTVDPLPSWAQGTFAGGWEISNEDTAPASGGQVSLTISAAGKLSGKALGDGLKYTLAAPYYSDFVTVPDEDGLVSNFLADVTASWSCREGSKTIRTNEIVQVSVADNGIGGYAEVADWFEAYTVNWKVEPWKTLGKAFDKQIRTYAIMSDGTISEREDDLSASLGESIAGRVSLKFASNGNVSVAGEFVAGYDAKKARYATVKATGAAMIVPVDGERGVVFVYLTPKGLSPYVCCVEVLLP